jgi:hypothetical protein
LVVATTSTPAVIASPASASLRAESSGWPWSHSSTATLWGPNVAISAWSSRAAAAGPSAMRARGTDPFRQPVSTSQWSSWTSAKAMSS